MWDSRPRLSVPKALSFRRLAKRDGGTCCQLAAHMPQAGSQQYSNAAKCGGFGMGQGSEMAPPERGHRTWCGSLSVFKYCALTRTRQVAWGDYLRVFLHSLRRQSCRHFKEGPLRILAWGVAARGRVAVEISIATFDHAEWVAARRAAIELFAADECARGREGKQCARPIRCRAAVWRKPPQVAIRRLR